MILKKLQQLPPGIRRMGVFIGWMAALVLVGSLLWGLTQPLRNRMLLRSVNRILVTTGENMRLEKALSPWKMPGRVSQLGTWYTVADSETRAVVLPIIADGILSPVLGIISPGGTVDSLIPLSTHAASVLHRLPPGNLKIYIRRIEVSHALLRRAVEGKND